MPPGDVDQWQPGGPISSSAAEDGTAPDGAPDALGGGDSRDAFAAAWNTVREESVQREHAGAAAGATLAEAGLRPVRNERVRFSRD